MRILKIVCMGVLIGSITSFCFAQEVERIAQVSDLKGSAQVRLTGEQGWIFAEVGMILHQGDILKTEGNSFVILSIDGKEETAIVEIEENSQLMISELVKDEERGSEKTLLDLAIGKILIKAKKIYSPESKFEVKTPTSVVAVRGTVFLVEVEALE